MAMDSLCHSAHRTTVLLGLVAHRHGFTLPLADWDQEGCLTSCVPMGHSEMPLPSHSTCYSIPSCGMDPASSFQSDLNILVAALLNHCSLGCNLALMRNDKAL